MKILSKGKLEEYIRDECQNGDLGERIRRNCERNYIADKAIENKSLSYAPLEMWSKTFKRSKEDLDAEHDLKSNAHRSDFSYSGENDTTILVVPYPENIPNSAIKIPEEMKESYESRTDGQHQIIFNKNALILRTIHADFARTHIGFGDMIYNSKRPTLNLMKAFLGDLAQHPYRYLYGFLTHKAEDDRKYPLVLLFPKEELNLDEWWNIHEKEMMNSAAPNKGNWNDLPLVYPHVIRPVLENSGYLVH